MTEAAVDATPVAPPTTVQKLAAEALGTFVLVFFGTATVLASGGDYVAVALAFGLTVLTMAYAVGHISGGHFNPAVSVGAALAGRLSWATAAVYAVTQIVAGFAAALVLGVVAKLFYDDTDWGTTLSTVANKWDTGFGSSSLAFLAAFLVELIGTFFFVFIILGVTDRRRTDERIPAPVAIGLALTLCHLMLIGLTGCSVNPARSLGPGILSFDWDGSMKYQWLFLVAPLVGGALAGFVHPLLFGRDGLSVPGSGLTFGGGAVAGDPGAVNAFEQQWNQQAYAQQQPADQQPIIQDGWQWDPNIQQWIPAQQPAAPQQPAQGWAPPAPGDQTQVRPPGT